MVHESGQDLVPSPGIFTPKHRNTLNTRSSPHKLPVAAVCYREVSLLLAQVTNKLFPSPSIKIGSKEWMGQVCLESQCLQGLLPKPHHLTSAPGWVWALDCVHTLSALPVQLLKLNMNSNGILVSGLLPSLHFFLLDLGRAAVTKCVNKQDVFPAGKGSGPGWRGAELREMRSRKESWFPGFWHLGWGSPPCHLPSLCIVLKALSYRRAFDKVSSCGRMSKGCGNRIWATWSCQQ